MIIVLYLCIAVSLVCPSSRRHHGGTLDGGMQAEMALLGSSVRTALFIHVLRPTDTFLQIGWLLVCMCRHHGGGQAG
jgi:hypothetical protein